MKHVNDLINSLVDVINNIYPDKVYAKSAAYNKTARSHCTLYVYFKETKINFKTNDITLVHLTCDGNKISIGSAENYDLADPESIDIVIRAVTLWIVSYMVYVRTGFLGRIVNGNIGLKSLMPGWEHLMDNQQLFNRLKEIQVKLPATPPEFEQLVDEIQNLLPKQKLVRSVDELRNIASNRTVEIRDDSDTKIGLSWRSDREQWWMIFPGEQNDYYNELPNWILARLQYNSSGLNVTWL